MNMERIRWKLGAPSALKLFGHVLGFAGLEFAILDIQGKALNKSVCALLGGKVRDEVQFSAYLFYRYANDAGMHSGAEFGISQAAMLHLAASLPNLTLAPDSHYHHLTDDIIEGGKMKYKDGGMSVPTGPGLGVSLDRDKLARYHELSRRQEMGSWIEDPRRPGVITTQPKW